MRCRRTYVLNNCMYIHREKEIGKKINLWVGLTTDLVINFSLDHPVYTFSEILIDRE